MQRVEERVDRDRHARRSSSSSSGPRCPTSGSTSSSPTTGSTSCAHYLRSARRYRPHLLTEPEEKILAEKDVTGSSAWSRLFDELTSDDHDRARRRDRSASSRACRCSRRPTAPARQAAAAAVTEGLAPGLRTRAFVFNTLLADKSTDDRLRALPELDREPQPGQRGERRVGAGARRRGAVGRNDIPQRWYALKAQLLGVDRLADYDRMASRRDRRRRVRLGRGDGRSCSTRTPRSRRSSPTSARGSSTRAGSTRRCGRASGRARSARTRCRRSTRSCC